MARLDYFLKSMLNEGATGLHLSPGSPPELVGDDSSRTMAVPPFSHEQIASFIDEIATKEDLDQLERTGSCEILYEYAGQYFNCHLTGGPEPTAAFELVDPELLDELAGPTGELPAARSAEFEDSIDRPPLGPDEKPVWSIRPALEASGEFEAPKFEGLPQETPVRGRAAVDEYLEWMARNKATDMHLTPNWAPTLRIDNLFRRSNLQPLTGDQIRAMIYGILHTDDRKEYERDMSVDLAYSLQGVGRFRMSAFNQLNGPALSVRHIPEEVGTVQELGLPLELRKLAEYRAGLVLFCGPTGSGKSTTQAALIRQMNETQSRHVITLEDPIEYIHQSKNCLIQQREVGQHAKNFARGLRDALREDPDVIVVGEMRDVETITLALNAAETGHLVYGTLHINSTINSVSRMVDAFSEHQQHGVRAQIAESLKAVVNQRLLTHRKGVGLVPIVELMKVNHAIGALIREDKMFQIVQVLVTSLGEGMFTFERSAADALLDGRITEDDAERVSPDLTVFKQIRRAREVQRAGNWNMTDATTAGRKQD